MAPQNMEDMQPHTPRGAANNSEATESSLTPSSHGLGSANDGNHRRHAHHYQLPPPTQSSSRWATLGPQSSTPQSSTNQRAKGQDHGSWIHRSRDGRSRSPPRSRGSGPLNRRSRSPESQRRPSPSSSGSLTPIQPMTPNDAHQTVGEQLHQIAVQQHHDPFPGDRYESDQTPTPPPLTPSSDSDSELQWAEDSMSLSGSPAQQTSQEEHEHEHEPDPNPNPHQETLTQQIARYQRDIEDNQSVLSTIFSTMRAEAAVLLSPNSTPERRDEALGTLSTLLRQAQEYHRQLGELLVLETWVMQSEAAKREREMANVRTLLDNMNGFREEKRAWMAELANLWRAGQREREKLRRSESEGDANKSHEAMSILIWVEEGEKLVLDCLRDAEFREELERLSWVVDDEELWRESDMEED